MRRLVAGVLGVMMLSGTVARGADWPQFQGPGRNGVSEEKGLANAWPEAGPKLLWSNDKMGQGYGGAVVQGGKIYVMDRVGNKQDVLRCLSLETGEEEWQYAVDAPGAFKGGYNGSRNLPAVDEKNVYITGVFGDLSCISKETHQPVWSTNLVKDYGAIVSNWGFCQSPVLYKDWVIVMPLSKEVGLLALEKETGKVVWKSARTGGMAWTSPYITSIGGVDQVLVLSERGDPVLRGLEVSSGKVLWQYKDWKCPNPIASPIAVGEGKIFVTGGYDAGSALIQVSKDGEEWKVTEIFRNKNFSSQAQNPVFYQGYIYGNSSGNKQGLMCLDLSGEIKWKGSPSVDEEDVGSVLVADGKMYALGAQNGTLCMVEAKPDGFKELGKVKVAEGREFWGPMALSDGKLLVRLRGSLKCYDVKAGE